ncbi:MAG: XRE family transcriptional regulator [Prevotella sp.]|nr:XRE family transcriptional regulator [Prevotella sp.]
MHIGQKIKEVMDERHASVVYVAKQLGCERTNVYNIFVREDINTRLLQQLSRTLNYDFFSELSKETFGNKPTIH